VPRRPARTSGTSGIGESGTGRFFQFLA